MFTTPSSKPTYLRRLGKHKSSFPYNRRTLPRLYYLHPKSNIHSNPEPEPEKEPEPKNIDVDMDEIDRIFNQIGMYLSFLQYNTFLLFFFQYSHTYDYYRWKGGGGGGRGRGGGGGGTGGKGRGG